MDFEIGSQEKEREILIFNINSYFKNDQTVNNVESLAGKGKNATFHLTHQAEIS